MSDAEKVSLGTKPATLGLPASSLTDAQLDAEDAYLDAVWKEYEDMLEESGGGAGSPGEWIFERTNEIDTARQRQSIDGCPKCGGDSDIEYLLDENYDISGWQVYCQNCNASSAHRNRRDAVLAWRVGDVRDA
jgi:hypothetical protein